MPMAETKSTALMTVKDLEAKYPDNQFNRLFPSTQLVENVQRFQRLNIEIVKIDPDPKAQEVFSLGKTKVGNNWVKKLSFTKTALDKIAFTMGIVWIPEKCIRVDDRSNRDYFEFRATALVTKADGQKVELSNTKAIDVLAYVEETHQKLRNELEDGKLRNGFGNNAPMFKPEDPAALKVIERRTRDREIELRKHGLSLAESGAKNRLIRTLNVKPWYTEEELALPFVVPRIDRDVEEMVADPATRAEIIDNGSNAMKKVFGNEDNAPPKQSTPEDSVEEAEFTPVEETTEAAGSEGVINEADQRNIFLEEVKSMQTDERIKAMDRMIKGKALAHPTTKKPLDANQLANKPSENQIENLMWAYDQPTPEALVDDGFPA